MKQLQIDILWSRERAPMGGAPYKSAKEGVGTLLSNHKDWALF